MRALFVDTAGWMACADAADPAHRRASAARDAALEGGRTLVTTDYVLDETLTLIRRLRELRRDARAEAEGRAHHRPHFRQLAFRTLP